MKDCKWNPPTFGSKGQHFALDGTPLERADLASIPDGTPLLKFLDDTGDRKSRRRAARELERLQASGTLEAILDGTIDPPAGWAVHIRDAERDRLDPKKMVTMATQHVALLFRFIREDDQVFSPRAYKDAQIAIEMLLRQGRITKADLAQPLAGSSRNLERDAYISPRRGFQAALALGASLPVALELSLRHGDLPAVIDQTDPQAAHKLMLLRLTSTNLNPYLPSAIPPARLLEYATGVGMSFTRFDELAKRSRDVALAAGPFATKLLDSVTTAKGEPSPELLLSVLKDPVDQRALAAVLTAAKSFSNSPSDPDPVATLAAAATGLPDGASDLDRLVRAAAAGIRARHITGTPEEAGAALLDFLAGSPGTPPRTRVEPRDGWSHGPLGVTTTQKLLGTDRPGSASTDPDLDATKARLAAACERAADGSWDTLLLPAKPTPADVALAALLELSTTAPSDDLLSEAARVATEVGASRSLRDLARHAAESGTVTGELLGDLYAASFLADATRDADAAPAAVKLLAQYMNGEVLTDAEYLSPTAGVLAQVARDAAARNRPGGSFSQVEASSAVQFPDPYQEAAYRRARAAAGDLLDSRFEVFVTPESDELSVTVAVAPGENQVALALRIEDLLAEKGAPVGTQVTNRTGETVITMTPSVRLGPAGDVPLASDADAYALRRMLVDELVVLPKIAASGGDPEFYSLLQEEAEIRRDSRTFDPMAPPPREVDPEFARLLEEEA
jgi:hypothetical protein